MPTTTPSRFEQGRPMLFAGLRRHHAFTDAAHGIARQWREFESHPLPVGRIGERRYGVMCGSSRTGIEYMCAVEVTSFDGQPPETGKVRVHEQRYAVFEHRGGPETIASTWEGILAWFERTTLQSAQRPDFEVYAPGASVIEIYVSVK